LGKRALVRGLADFLDERVFVANEIGHESSTMFLTAKDRLLSRAAQKRAGRRARLGERLTSA
jgi:hypothetical protein